MKRLKTLSALALLVFACAMLLPAAWTSKRLTYNSGGSEIPGIAVSGANIYVVWMDNTTGNWEIYFRRSSDSGVTWMTSKRLTHNAGDSMFPSVAASDDNVYVTWHDETPGQLDIYFRRSTDSGATWESAKRLTNNTGSSQTTRVAMSGSNVYVCWSDNTPGNCEIYFRKSTDSGATWMAAKRITNNFGYSLFPAIATDGANIYAAWGDSTPGNFAIYFKKSTDEGSHWGAVKRLSKSSYYWDTPAMAVNGSSIFLACLSNSTGNNEIHFTKSEDSGATWASFQQMTDTSGDSQAPKIAVSGANVYLVWYDDDPGNDEVYFRKSASSGDSWGSAQRLTTNAGDSAYPTVAVNAVNVYVAYHDTLQGDTEIYVKYKPL